VFFVFEGKTHIFCCKLTDFHCKLTIVQNSLCIKKWASHPKETFPKSFEHQPNTNSTNGKKVTFPHAPLQSFAIQPETHASTLPAA
jgi:hypothetical protein